jgi:hypothetical protein
MDSSFFRFFYFKFFKFLKNFKFDRAVFEIPVTPVPTSFSGFLTNFSVFYESRPVFERFFNPCEWLHSTPHNGGAV